MERDILFHPPPLSPLKVTAALRMVAKFSADSRVLWWPVSSDGNHRMLINQGQAELTFPRLPEEAIQQSWVVYFFLSFPLITLV